MSLSPAAHKLLAAEIKELVAENDRLKASLDSLQNKGNMKSADQWAKKIMFGDEEFTGFVPTDQYMIEFSDLVNKIAVIQQESNAVLNIDLVSMLKAVHEAFTTVGTRKAMEEALWGYEVLIARAEGADL